MKLSLRASLAAVLCLYAGTALAGSAVLNSDMTAFEGPGDSYRPVLHLVAGQRVDILECDIKQWCRVEHEGTLGWVHARLASPSAAGAGSNGKLGQGGTPGAIDMPGSGGDSASGGGGTSGGKSGGSGGGSRPTFSTVGGGITQIDDGSTGGGGFAARQAASASSGGSDSSDSPPASVATEAAKAPSCLRC